MYGQSGGYGAPSYAPAQPAPDPYADYGYTYGNQPYEAPPEPVYDQPQQQAQPQYQEQPAPVYDQPQYDSGYTLDQQPAPSQPAPQGPSPSYEQSQPPPDYVTMPGDTTAYNPSTGEQWAPPAASPNPADAWLGPRTNPSRDPVMPEPEPYAPQSSDPYQTGNAYSTGPERQDTWRTPAGDLPPEPQTYLGESIQPDEPYQPTTTDPYGTGDAYSTGPDQVELWQGPTDPRPDRSDIPDMPDPATEDSLFDAAGGWVNDQRNQLGAIGDVLTDRAPQFLADNPETTEFVRAVSETELSDPASIGAAYEAGTEAVDEQAGPLLERVIGDTSTAAQALWSQVPDVVADPAEWAGGKAVDAAQVSGRWNVNRVGQQIYDYHTTGAEPTTPYAKGFITDIGIHQANPVTVKAAYENGYNGYTGGEAVWHLVNDQENPGGIAGGIMEAGYDPATVFSAFVPGLKAATTGTKLSKLGTLAEAADVATSLPFSLPGAGRSVASRFGRAGIGDVATDTPTTIPVSDEALATWPQSVDAEFPEWRGATAPPPEPVTVPLTDAYPTWRGTPAGVATPPQPIITGEAPPSTRPDPGVSARLTQPPPTQPEITGEASPSTALDPSVAARLTTPPPTDPTITGGTVPSSPLDDVSLRSREGTPGPEVTGELPPAARQQIADQEQAAVRAAEDVVPPEVPPAASPDAAARRADQDRIVQLAKDRAAREGRPYTYEDIKLEERHQDWLRTSGAGRQAEPAAITPPSRQGRTTPGGAALSDEGWTPPTTRLRADEAPAGPNVVTRLQTGEGTGGKYLSINDKPLSHPDNVRLVNRAVNEHQSPSMTTQRWEDPVARGYRAAMYERGIISQNPAAVANYPAKLRPSYERWLKIVAPLYKKEPQFWDATADGPGIFARDKMPPAAVEDVKRVAAGEPIKTVVDQRIASTPPSARRSTDPGLLPDPTLAPAEWFEATRGIRESGLLSQGQRRGVAEEDRGETAGVEMLDAVLEGIRTLPGRIAEDPKQAGLDTIEGVFTKPQQGVEEGIAGKFLEDAQAVLRDPNADIRFSAMDDDVEAFVRKNAALIDSISRNGFTPETGSFQGQTLYGNRAVWEYMILNAPGWAQFGAQIATDPWNLALGAGAIGRGLKQAKNAPDLVRGIGSALAGPDDLMNLGVDAALGAGKGVVKGIGNIPIAGAPVKWLLDYAPRTKAIQATNDFISASNEARIAEKAPFGAPLTSDAAEAALGKTFQSADHPLAGQTHRQAWDDFTNDAAAAQTEYTTLKAVRSPNPAQQRRITQLQDEWGHLGGDLATADPRDLGAARTALEVSLDHGLDPKKPRGFYELVTNGLAADGLLHTPGGLHWGYALRNLNSNPVLSLIQRENPLPLLGVFNPKNWRAVLGEADPKHLLAKGTFDDLPHVGMAKQLGIGVPPQVSKSASSVGEAGGSSAFTQLMQRLGMNKLVRPGGKQRAFAPTEHAKAINEGLEASQRGLMWQHKMGQEMADNANVIRNHAAEQARRAGLSITPDEIDTALKNVGKGNNLSATDVATAMRDLAASKGAKPAAADAFATNSGKRQANLVRTSSERALRNTENVFIGYYPRNIDRIIGAGTTFHYWPTRAGMKVAESALRSPAIITNYLAAFKEGGMDKLTQSDNPAVAGMARIASSVFGFGLFANPAFLNPIAALVQQRADQFVPIGETRVGMITREAEKLGVRSNWILDGLMNMAGIQGDTFAPTLLPRKDVPVFLGLVDTVLTQMGGQPHEPFLAQWLSDQRENVTTRLNEMGLPVQIIEAGSETGYVEDRIASLIREQHPELTDEEWDAAVREGWGNPLWDEAARANSAMGLATRLNSAINPVPITARIEGRDADVALAKEARETPPEDQTPEMKQALINRNIATDTPEAKEWADTTEGYWNLGTDEQQQLAKATNAIRYANEDMARPITVDGEVYTRERLAGMTEEERRTVANAWLNAQPGARESYNAYQDERTAYREANPGVQGLDALANEHPLGQQGFIDDLRERSPRYNAYIESLSAEPGSTEWYDKALNSSGYANAVGNEWGVYDKDLPGDPTIATEVAQFEADAQAEWDAKQAEWEQVRSDERFGVTESIRYYTGYLDDRVEFIESWGMSPEDTAYVTDLYVNNAYGITDEQLPYWIWDPLRDQFGADYVYPSFTDNEYKGKAKGYLQALSQNPDLELDDFLTEYRAQKKRERESFDLNEDVILPGRR